MFSKRNKSIWRTTSFRLAFGVSLLFSLSSLVFFGSVYAYFFHSLRDTDQSLIRSKLKQYSIIYQEQGVGGLRKLFSDDRSLKNEARFSLRVQDPDGKILLFRLSDDLNEFNTDHLEKDFEKKSTQPGWSYIDALNRKDQLEVLTDHLENEATIQVAKSTSERVDFLERATEVFVIATLLSLLIGGFGGYWFSRRTLRPLRDLVHTTQMISKENLNQRVKDTGSDDEFSELVHVFNSMLDRIQGLVNGMQDSLDSIAHDMKTPMTRMKAAADIALTKDDLSLEGSRAALQECSENSQEILTLLNSLLDIFEADSGAMKLNVEQFQLQGLIMEVFDLYEIIAEEKKISLANQVPSAVMIYADRLRLKQVIANLIDNAIKYSPAESSISVGVFLTKAGWEIQVEDQGIGIPIHEISRIWERHYRGSQIKAQPGSGLGLSLVSAIMKAHGGKAWVESAPDRGTQFTVLIPRTWLLHSDPGTNPSISPSNI